jgi:hypothetical protein
VMDWGPSPSRCFSPSPSPSPLSGDTFHCSAKWTVESELIHSPLFMLHVNNWEWPAFAVSTVPQSITTALLFPFPFSFSFVWRHSSLFTCTCNVNTGFTLHSSRCMCMWTVESVFTVHGRTGSNPNLKALDRSDPVK